MPLPTRITLPPSGRAVGGLLSAARPIGAADWWRGVTFASGQCIPPQNVGSCTDGEVSKTMNVLDDSATFDTFAVLQAIECSTMGRPQIEALAADGLDATVEYGVAQELLTGAATGNPSLADATVPIAAASDPDTALGCLEQAAASALFGRRALIHVSPALGVSLATSGTITKEGRMWFTPTGNVVVISPGYDGREPGGPAPSGGDPLFMYATGQVYAEHGQREELTAYERGQNSLQVIAEEVALVVFDPCFVIAIDSGMTACETVS